MSSSVLSEDECVVPDETCTPRILNCLKNYLLSKFIHKEILKNNLVQVKKVKVIVYVNEETYLSSNRLLIFLILFL